MAFTANMLFQIAEGLSKQFGPDCEVVIHDLRKHDTEHSIVFIANGHITHRKVGDGPSRVVLETLHSTDPASLKDHIGYLTKSPSGRILKSSTFYIHSKDGTAIDYILSINYDITNLLAIGHSLQGLITTDPEEDQQKQPEQIVTNVNDLLDSLIEQSVVLVGKPVALMNKDDKVRAIQFLNNAGAFLITRSGDKVSKYFGISKYTLYSYIDVNNHKETDATA